MTFATKNIGRFAVMLLLILLSIAPLSAQVIPLPPPPPVDQPIVTPDPTLEVTPNPESTVEVTPIESTPEPTVEATPIEVTPNPESTVEVTPNPESTAEATPTTEPTVEATPQAPVQSLPYDATKVVGVLAELLAAYNNGGQAAADTVAALHYVTFNTKGRTPMQVYGVPTTSIEALRVDLQALAAPQGSPTDYGVGLNINLSLVEAAALSLSPNVIGMSLAPSLASVETLSDVDSASTRGTRAPVGEEATVGYTLLGIEAWHRAGYTGGLDGNRINIALIDVGFGTTTTVDSDISCYRGSTIAFAYPSNAAPAAGDSFRGRYMAEVICDVAPGANVRFYKATSATQLAAAINAASTGGNDIIVMGVDLGVNIAAGDGGQNGAASVYTAITNAKSNGIVVIGAAGDNGKAQKTFTLNTNASLEIKAGPGDRVNVGWNGWSDASNIRGTLSGGGLSGSIIAERTPGGEAGFQLTVTTCNTNSAGLCTLTLGIDSVSAGIGKTVQVQVLTTKTKVGTEQTFVNGVEATLTGGGTLITNAGNIARPADSANVIAVGAVCASPESQYPSLDYAAKGPVYAAGGTFSGLPTLPYKRGQVKPDVVSAAHVSVNAGGGLPVASGAPCSTGFGGSQASAAHVAGMAALLLENTTNSTFQTLTAHDRVRDYLQQRSFEMPFGVADGFDMQFGAGFATLGSPTFDYDSFFASPSPSIAPNRLPASADCSGGTLYVGQHNYGSPSMDGSLANPYHSVMQAVTLASATPNTCVVVAGGEYATPFYFTNNLINPVQVYGYSSVVRELVAPSIINLLNAYLAPQVGNDPLRYGGVMFNNTNGHTLYGFTFNELSLPDTSGMIISDVLPSASAVVAYTSPNVKIINNTFNNFTQRQFYNIGLVEVAKASHGAQVIRNTFSGNTSAQVYPPTSPVTYNSQLMLLNVAESGTSGNPVKVEFNTFSNNAGVLGVYTIADTVRDTVGTGPSDSIPFYPLVRGLNSYVDFVNNQFTGNQFETLLAVATSRITPGSTADSIYRIFGNTFVANTARSEDGDKRAGPLVQLFNAPKTYIVNNTFANNTLKGDMGAFASIIGRGSGNRDDYETPSGDLSYTGSMNDAPFDVHNNVFFLNRLAPAGAIVRDIGVFAFDFQKDCRSNTSYVPATPDGVAQSGATNNFAYRNGPSAIDGMNNLGSSDCQGAFNDPARNNRIAVNPLPLDEEYNPTGDTRYFLSDTLPDTSPLTAGYYMMIPAIGTGADQNIDGVDAGNETIINAVFPSYLAGDDARGVSRRINSGGGLLIDIGAFEYTPLTVTQENFAETFSEDGGPNVLNIASFIEGGFPPYSLEVNSYPQYFGTSCGTAFTSAARGVVTNTPDADNVLLFYCPPDDFHTSTTVQGYNNNGTLVSFTLRDSTNASVSGLTVLHTVTPIADSPLSTVIGDNVPEGDLQIVGAALGTTTTVRARPWVRFDRNFAFSERTNTLEPSLQNQVDYDYTYSNIQRVSGTCPDGIASDPSMPLPTVVNGRFVFDLTGISSDITTCFTYNVTDRSSTGTTGNVVIVKALESPNAFTLTSPGAGALPAPLVGSRYDVTKFVWVAPSNVANFAAKATFAISITSTTLGTVWEVEGLTPAADTDTLTCDATTCTYTTPPLLRDALVAGDYEWTVTAFNETLGVEASNAPFYFQVTAQEQLIRNGSFEQPGTKPTLAQNWALVPSTGTNAKRICVTTPSANCFFAIIGKAGTNIILRQNAIVRGDAKDVLTFSGVVKRNKAQGGTIQVIVTYTNNKKVIMTYNVPKGTGDYTPFTRQVALTGTVKAIRVQAVSKSLAGRFDVDNMSLTLTREKTFQMLTPLNNAVSSTVVGTLPDDRRTLSINRLTWNETEDVSGYRLTLKRVLPSEQFIYNAELFTAAADSDPLTCKNNLCVFVLPAGALDMVTPENRVFEWIVAGTNGVTAANGPFTFTIRGTERELLANGNLDTRNTTTKLPQGWQTPGRVADKMLCINATTHAWPSYQGACSYQFIGKNVSGFNSRLVRTIPTAKLTAEGVNQGDVLNLRFVASGVKVVDKAARVTAKVTLTNNQVRNIVVVMPKGNFGYTEFSGSLTLGANETPKSIVVTAQYTGKSGNYKIDNISVSFEAGDVNP